MPMQSDPHAPSPDDSNIQVGVLIKKRSPQSFTKYADQYRLFRKPIDIKEQKNCFILASSQVHTSANLSSGHILPTPRYTLFTAE